LVVGHFATWVFLKVLRARTGIGTKPGSITPPKRLAPWLTGVVERLFFTVLIGFNVAGAPPAMIGWLAVKLATNWNHPIWKEDPDVRTFALSALLAGLVSMGFAVLGGVICAGVWDIGV